MNNPEYKKAYLANLNQEISNNNKHSQANKINHSHNQYVDSGNKAMIGVPVKIKTKKK